MHPDIHLASYSKGVRFLDTLALLFLLGSFRKVQRTEMRHSHHPTSRHNCWYTIHHRLLGNVSPFVMAPQQQRLLLLLFLFQAQIKCVACCKLDNTDDCSWNSGQSQKESRKKRNLALGALTITNTVSLEVHSRVGCGSRVVSTATETMQPIRLCPYFIKHPAPLSCAGAELLAYSAPTPLLLL